jgi:3' terminal RNA ribose 2'-O-methyltransferase Hen1
MNRLMETDDEPFTAPEIEDVDVVKEKLHDKRLKWVLKELVDSGATSVLDLGCGEGKLLRMLLREKQFTRILGVDVSYRTLEKAKQRINYDELPVVQKERITLLQGALTYRDRRLEGFDAAAIVEVIEHLDLSRLKAFERVIFESARPNVVILTTPNQEYNTLFETMEAGGMRHADHRFEWTRTEFETWANGVAERNNYGVLFKAIGDEDERVGAPTQVAIFKKQIV